MENGKWNHPGFTMLEVVIAILLLTIGALGYAALSASLARSSFLDARRSRSAELAVAQMEALLRQGCAAAISGSALRFGMPVEWSVRTVGPGTKSLTVVVTRAGISGTHSDSLSTVMQCG